MEIMSSVLLPCRAYFFHRAYTVLSLLSGLQTGIYVMEWVRIPAKVEQNVPSPMSRMKPVQLDQTYLTFVQKIGRQERAKVLFPSGISRLTTTEKVGCVMDPQPRGGDSASITVKVLGYVSDKYIGIVCRPDATWLHDTMFGVVRWGAVGIDDGGTLSR